MKMFISWSGNLSHEVGIALRDWLPSVIQSIEPYVSSEDIDKGARWSSDIGEELEKSSFGIICVTEDNLNAPWLHFESGALSKKINQSFVCPLLFNLKKSDLKGPLVQFQMTVCEKEDIYKLLQTINTACGDAGLSEDRLKTSFDVWWPKLEEQFINLKGKQNKSDNTKKNTKAGAVLNEDILEEMLELLRNQNIILNSPMELLPKTYLQSILKPIKNSTGILPEAIDDLNRGILFLENIINKNKCEENVNVDVDDLIRLNEMLRKPCDYIFQKYEVRGRKVGSRWEDDI